MGFSVCTQSDQVLPFYEPADRSLTRLSPSER